LKKSVLFQSSAALCQVRRSSQVAPFPSRWFGGALLRIPGIKVPGNYGGATFPGVFCNLFKRRYGLGKGKAWRHVTAIESYTIHMDPSEAISAFFFFLLICLGLPQLHIADFLQLFVTHSPEFLFLYYSLMSAMSTFFSMTFCSSNDWATSQWFRLI